jgi:hypothetical protein
MGKRVKVALAVVVVALVGVIVWQVWPPSDEPVYQGKPLSSWVRGYWTGHMTEADEAVRQAGTNAIPTLLRMLRAKDSALKVKLITLAQRQHIIEIEYTAAGIRNYTALNGFRALGDEAQSAAPALIEILNDNISRESQVCTIAALLSIGPSGKEAVPSLLRWATNADAAVSANARRGLLRIDPEAAAKAGITNSLGP